jgi:predicted dehydrogenase
MTAGAARTGEAPVRWGILGAGGIARTVGAAIAGSPDSVVTAVASRDGDRAAAAAADLGADRSYGDYRRLLDDRRVDVVYVATTHDQHYRQVLDVLAAGRAVLVEKPMTVTAEQTRRLITVARDNRLFLMEALWTRCLPLVRAAVALAADGAIGRVVGMRSDKARNVARDPAHRLWDRATAGGALLDLGVYPAHLALLFLGPPDHVSAVARMTPEHVDSTTAVQWAYDDGRHAHLVASFDGWTAGPHTVLSGENGFIALHGPTQVPTSATCHRPGEDDITVSADELGTGYGPQVAEVERCLRTGRTESELVPPGATWQVLRALDAARAQVSLDYGSLEQA